MKLQKFFGRDKPKPTKVTPLGRDVDIDDESTLFFEPPFSTHV